MTTIRDLEVELRNDAIIAILISLYLLFDIKWTVANIAVELHGAGAWNPWAEIGIIWYIVIALNMVCVSYQLYCLKTDELARLVVG